MPASWQSDQVPCYYPVADTPNLFAEINGSVLGGRTFVEVAFPAAKVFAFEEFEWQPHLDPSTGTWVSDGTYFAYPNAHVGKLMFDGSVNDWATSGSGHGWNPYDPDDPADPLDDWQQRYLPLDQFPLPKPRTDEGRRRKLYQWFRWTRDGLQGVDYPTAP
ncbi:MAG: hypothetical protein R3B49_02090 [Phycisphaerales bacterium]